MKTLYFVLGLWTAAAWMGSGAAAIDVRAGGAQVDVDRGGVRVDVGTKERSEMPVVRIRDIIGLRVTNPNNEKLGEIEDVVIDPASGHIRYAVLSYGGFLGIADKLFAVPWKDLTLVPKGTTSAGTLKEDHYVLDVSKDALKNAPGFAKNHWPDFADRSWNADIDKFYAGQRATAVRGTQTR